jgi:riboflavin kinase/FMN adenylyltransferase
MQVHRDLSHLPPFRRAVLTIGSFDGVHAGHQHILARLREAADDLGGECVVVTFEPHPRLVLQPDAQDLHLLTDIEEKTDLLARYGVDHLVVAPFTESFSKQPPETYVADFLVRRFQPELLVIGYDHRFGQGRRGDIALLQAMAPQYGYAVEEIPRQTVDDIAVSSTKIRQALETGDLSAANHLLGHPYTLRGTVVKGDQLGRTIGFPTANLRPASVHKLVPVEGIYAVRARIENEIIGGMLYIGERPTVADGLQRTIEVNLFDFDRDIYGRTVTLELLRWLRADEKFDGLETLRDQLRRDELAARSVLENFPSVFFH